MNLRQEHSNTRARTETSKNEADQGAVHRIVVLNARPNNLPLCEQLGRLGYDVVADTAKAELALTLVDSLLPDAVLIAADSLDVENVLLTTRLVRDRHACAIVLLTSSTDAVTLAQFKAVRPHGIIPLPVAAGLLDVAIQTALSVVSESRHAVRTASLPEATGAPRAAERARFEDRFAIAAARAARSGSRFGVGAAETDSAVSPEALERLRGVLRQTDVIFVDNERRLVFLSEDVDTDALDALGRRLCRTLAGAASGVDAPEGSAPVIGMALWNAPDDGPERLLNAANKALDEVKRSGGNGWSVAPSPNEPIRADARETAAKAPLRPRVLVQRTVGWVSLIALGWLIVNYTGLSSTEQVQAQWYEVQWQLRDFAARLSLR